MNSEIYTLESEIKNDGAILKQVKKFIDSMRTPFSFLSTAKNANLKELKTQEKIEEEEKNQPA